MIEPGAKKYCSNACRQKHYRRELKAKRGKVLKLMVTRRCRYCGKQFQTDNRQREYCSPNHKKQNYREQRRLRESDELVQRLDLWCADNAQQQVQPGRVLHDSTADAVRAIIQRFEQPQGQIA
jgi:hypothetical protein